MKPIVVIACYRPKSGKDAELLAVVKEHLPILRAENLVTERKAIVAKSTDGTIIEIFEWKSEAAIDAAHKNPHVLALWERFEACSTYHPVGDLAEATELFAGYEPVDF